MAMDSTTFETVVPNRYVTFTFPNPLPHPLHTPLLRIAVLDSPSATTATAVAAMLVPPNRHHDWTFSTQAGHLQLLRTSPHLSRLILISNYDSTCKTPQIEEKLMPLLFALTPKSAFDRNNRFPEIPFLNYEDDVVSSTVMEICGGPRVGEMLVENVELDFGGSIGIEFRRRLRFKRMPNLIQTQVRIHPAVPLSASAELDGVEFRVDNRVLVQPYLGPMVAALSLISSCLEKRIRAGFRPRALCLGVGGGALVEFLSSELGFEVAGVEEDGVVLRIAKTYFGLKESELVQLRVGDGIELIQKLAFEEKCGDGEVLNCVDGEFDVIMVDLDSSDATLGSSAPPLEFVRKSVLLAAKKILLEHGVVVLNVIAAHKSFYEMVIGEFGEVFEELYEIDVGNGENLVLVASPSAIGTTSHDGDSDLSFLAKLKFSVQMKQHMSSLRRILRAPLPKK